MAKARKPKAENSEARDLIKRIHQRYKVMTEADDANRRLAIDDMKFVNEPGHQWDDYMKRERGERPCYEFNKTRITVKRVINDMRANRPAGKVRAQEDGDKDTADIYEGQARNIWNISDGDTVIDGAAEWQVAAGIGAWRIDTQYVSDNSFDQDIVLRAIPNPLCLYADPAAKDHLYRDAQDWIVTERIAKSAYESRWKGSEVVDFESSEFDDEQEWEDEETVRICEYWWKEPYMRELWQLRDGKIIAADSDEAGLIQPEMVAKKRKLAANRIMMCIASGSAILEGPTQWAGQYFPFVLIHGETMFLDGRRRWFGLARFAKDAQRSYNVSRTAVSEAIALAPNFKWWATADQAQGHVEKWTEAHKKNYPFMLYNADPKSPGAPQSMPGPQVPVALIQECQMASDEIKAVTGIFDNSLGQEGNETSGRAIMARQRQGEIATFNYQDNLAKGIRRTWEIVIDLIPHVYDTERQLRVLGVDGAEKYVTVNQVVMGPDGKPVTVNDLSRGRYDVTVTVGPSFATQRQEAAEAYTTLAQRDPNVMMAAGDLVFKALDLPYANEIADRYKALLPPPIQQMLQEGAQSPEVAQAMAQVQQAMQQVDQKAQLVQAAEQELKELQAQAKSDQASAKLAQAQLKGAEEALQFQQKELDMAQRMLESAKQDALTEIQHATEILELRKQLAEMKISKAHDAAQHGLENAAHAQDMKESKSATTAD